MKDFRTCFRGLCRMFHPVRRKVSISVLAGLVSVALSLGFVLASKRVVDIATGAEGGVFRSSVAILLAVMTLQICCNVFARYWQGRVTIHTQNSTRRFVFERVMRSVWPGREKFHSGDTVNRLEDDIQEVSSFFTVSVPDVFIAFTQLVVASVYLSCLEPGLAWILVLIMPVAVGASRLFFRKLRQLSGEIRAADSRVQGYMQENIQHRVLVKTVGSTMSVLSKLGILQKEVWDKSLSRLNYAAVSRAFMSLGFTAGYALVFIWGANGLRHGTVTYGMMVAFLQLVGQIQRPVSNLANQIPAFIKALASEERLLELINLEQEDEGAAILFEAAPGIKVENLSFSYEDSGSPVLSSFSFDFLPGTMTAVNGPTGAGKSTLVRVLMSLLPADSGTVTIYDAHSCAPSSPDTRCNFMYVPQGNSLMSGTVRENLLIACQDASDDQLKEALHLAEADFVLDFKDGMDTPCSEVGGGLSEGQAQRIAVARALLKAGGILILDEATSALDSETERRLLSNIHSAFHGRKTIICITHRAPAVELSDAVVTIGD